MLLLCSHSFHLILNLSWFFLNILAEADWWPALSLRKSGWCLISIAVKPFQTSFIIVHHHRPSPDFHPQLHPPTSIFHPPPSPLYRTIQFLYPPLIIASLVTPSRPPATARDRSRSLRSRHSPSSHSLTRSFSSRAGTLISSPE
ncbi:uncharacterized protein EURHEDRAFT_163968 [Aspergillus ruber CBS 135680]|uniref:Uncharacterized protein n=1 Tax=Aspergillus ruber (strain CBS 135680) TaxID=1388766 RepID=A0A017SA84_ASPRC|nr:uncharacterized protein EURHEDRAFT_163968 [Aspergillus ruber CBS 135680]EYE93075.1 hypothetical protein EURHEDRAFT_163968 [Aspergillus ruber CBS 135680]